ncbi:MAG TPA: O-antigen ligase family protein [Chitinophagaceae bacterium]|nr:O-antigen ligase family protein [Chitinophagaceae bacterium]
MKNIFVIQDSLENKITYYHLAAFVILFPFDRFYSELVVISLLLHTLIHIKRSGLRSILSVQNLVLSSVFLISIISITWSSDKKEAFKDIERQLAILLFPVIFSIAGLDWQQYKIRILKIFGLTCVLTVLYLYADAIHIILYNKLPLTTLFSMSFLNHNFSGPVGLHATYCSMYVALSIAVFLHLFLNEKRNNYRLIYAVAIGILLAGLLQLASRSVLLATIILIIPGFPLFMPKGIQRFRFIVVSLLVLLIAILGITRIDSFKKRYVGDLKNDLTQASINNEILEPRIIRWHYAVELIKHSPVIGYGSGSEGRLLKEKYFENKLYNSYLNELNAHNQYLSILLKSGIAGLIIFLLTLIFGFAMAWLNRDIVFAAFMIIISIVSFSENILDMNKGIFFYAFFFSFFVMCSKPFAGFTRLIKSRKK